MSLIELTSQEIIKKSISIALPTIIKEGRKFFGKENESIQIDDFKSYINNQLKRCLKVRTIVSKHEEQDLRRIYSSTYFIQDSNVISDHDLSIKIRNGERFIVSGRGGSGKSFFSRYLWLNLLATSEKKQNSSFNRTKGIEQLKL